MAKVIPIDNVNVIRNGFFAPDFSLPDTDGHMFRIKENLTGNFICLVFFPDGKNERVAGHLKDLNSGLPKTSGGQDVRLVGISPFKLPILSAIKENLGLGFPLLSDQNLTVSKKYYIIAGNAFKLSTHFSIFVMDDAGIVRIRMFDIAGISRFDCGELRKKIADLV